MNPLSIYSRLLQAFLIGLLFCVHAAFATDYIVSGIPGTYAAANGKYVSQGALPRNGIEYWKHISANYYLYYDIYNGVPSWGMWYIDSDTEDEIRTHFYTPTGSSSAAPTDLEWFDYDYAEAEEFLKELQVSIAVTAVTAVPLPEINLRGNGTSIPSGAVAPSFADHTNFGSTPVSTGSYTRVYTIENIGTATLAVSSVTSSNTVDFTVTEQPAASVSALGSTEFRVTFHPTSAGVKTATITIANTDANEHPYTFDVSGYSFTNKNLEVSGFTLPVEANGSYTYQGIQNEFQYWKHESAEYYVVHYVTNAGVSHTWAIDNSLITSDGYPAYVSSGANMPTSLTWSYNSFYPTGSGTAQMGAGAVVVTEVDQAPEIDVQGNTFSITDGLSSPILYKNTHFGTLNIAGEVRTRTFQIQNSGSAALSLAGTSPVTITGANAGDFKVTTAPASSVAAGSTTSFVVTFDPATIGTKNAVLHIANNDDDESDFDFAIRGEAITPRSLMVSNIITPIAANGAYTYQGNSNEFQYWRHSSGNYYIYNYRLNNLHDPNWYIDGNLADTVENLFRTTTGATVASPLAMTWTAGSGSSGVPNITYAESEVKVVGNSIEITDGDAYPSEFDNTYFGAIHLTSGNQIRTFAIQNVGIETLTLSGLSPYVEISGVNANDFTLSTIPNASIASGASTNFVITFDPSALGLRTAIVTFLSNDADEATYNFTIQGHGGTYPSVSTQAVGAVGVKSAIGNGNLTDLGGLSTIGYGVCWNTTGTPTVADSKSDLGVATSTGAYEAPMNALLPDMTYYVRSYVITAMGTAYGAEVSLHTLPDPVVLETGAVTGVTTNAALAHGTLTYGGVPAATAYGICWNTSGAPTIGDTKIDKGVFVETGAYSATLNSLAEGTTYYVRAYATNLAGTVYGAEQSFTTLLPQTITFGNLAPMTYGESDLKLMATTNSSLPILYESSEPNVATIVGDMLRITGAGSTTITAQQGGNAIYAEAKAQNILKVNPRELTITGLKGVGRTYNQSLAVSLSGTPALSGVLTSDQGTVSLGGSATATIANTNVGTKEITVKGYVLNGARKNHYTLMQPTGLSATITPYAITVTADAKSIQQGKPNVPLTYKATDLLGDDEFSGALSREKGDAVGTYKILQGTLSAGDNYEITFKGANYVITKIVSIDPVVPFAAFTGRTQATLYNLRGEQVWSGMVDVKEGDVVLPNVGRGRWVVVP